MARIRSVHPGLFTDEAFAALSCDAQIFLVGLWTESDDQGVFEWKPVTLRMRLRPTKDGAVEGILSELMEANCVAIYEIDGRKLGAIRNFRKFQRPKSPNRTHPTTGDIRNYVGLSPVISEIDDDGGGSFPGNGEKPPQMKGEDVGGRGGGRTPTTSESNNQDTDRRRNSRQKGPYAFEAGAIRLNAADLEKWRKAFPNLSLESELIGLSAWAEQQPSWFNAVSGALAKKQREAKQKLDLAGQRDPSAPLWDRGL